MKNKLKEFCRSLGIEHMGIAGVGPYNDLERMLRERMEKGHHTEFEEKDLAKRIDPRLSLENAQSVIVFLFPYYVGDAADSNISKYTFGRDYHKIIGEKLQQIGEFLNNQIEDFQYKGYVDSGPLVDRYLGYRAGLGFYGINAHLITDQYGSYVFIGYIINNYPFEPDQPMDRTCIQCGKCVEMCPGSAILGNFKINPFRCKSYITQKKVELSTRDEEILKKSCLVFGCDICQDVCPHNKKVELTNMKEFKENIKTCIEHDEIAHISNKEFMRRYRERAFSWRGRKVILRNFEVIKKQQSI